MLLGGKRLLISTVLLLLGATWVLAVHRPVSAGVSVGSHAVESTAVTEPLEPTLTPPDQDYANGLAVDPAVLPTATVTPFFPLVIAYSGWSVDLSNPWQTFEGTPISAQNELALRRHPITVTPTLIGPCDQRAPADDLLTLVTRRYGLSHRYQPSDLVALSDYLSDDVIGYPTQVRQVIIEPLVWLIEAMQAAGLHPTIVSGFRSFDVQAMAREKWLLQMPERASMLSAPPGHSEHQLGTVVDISSPELPELVGQPFIEFHTDFDQTSEGRWLSEYAHEFGFTMSYPPGSLNVTGFFYEPWHYRYVGTVLATWLREEDLTLSEYLFQTQPVPCIP